MKNFKAKLLASLAATFASTSVFAADGDPFIQQVAAQISFADMEAGLLTVVAGSATIVLGVTGWMVMKKMIKSGH